MASQRRIGRAFGFTAILFAALGGGCDGTPASLRVVHASLDAQALDVYVRDTDTNQAIVFSNLSYTNATAYQKIARESEYVFELRPAGAAADSDPLFTSSTFNLYHSENATAVVAGLAGTGDDGAGLQVLLEEERFDLPAAGNAWVRVVNALPDLPDITFNLNGSPDVPVTTGTLSRFTAANVTLPAGQSLNLGAASSSGVQPVSTAFTTTLADGNPAFLVAIGLTLVPPRQGVAFDLLQIGSDGSTTLVQQDPFVYALHASPDALALDLFNDKTEVASGLGFGQLSSPIQLPPGDNVLDLYAHAPTNARPAGDPAASLQLGGLQAGQTYLAVAAGFVTAGRAPALAGGLYAESFDDAATGPLLRVIQGSPDLATTGMGDADTDPMVPISDFQNLAFLDATPARGTPIPPSFTLGVLPSGSTTMVARFDLTAQPNTRGLAVAAGAASPQPFDQPFQLLVVDVTQRPWTATAVSPATP